MVISVTAMIFGCRHDRFDDCDNICHHWFLCRATLSLISCSNGSRISPFSYYRASFHFICTVSSSSREMPLYLSQGFYISIMPCAARVKHTIRTHCQILPPVSVTARVFLCEFDELHIYRHAPRSLSARPRYDIHRHKASRHVWARTSYADSYYLCIKMLFKAADFERYTLRAMMPADISVIISSHISAIDAVIWIDTTSITSTMHNTTATTNVLY